MKIGGRQLFSPFLFIVYDLKCKKMNSTKIGKLQEQIQKYLLTSQTVMSYEQDKYTPYQNYLYKRALYGINSLDKEEVSRMCKKKIYRINNVHKRAQRVVNTIKQRKLIEITNNFFEKLFPNSAFTKAMLAQTETDDKFRNTLNFKDLNIDKDQIITIFIDEGVLPKNFLSLTVNPNQLPRLKGNGLL